MTDPAPWYRQAYVWLVIAIPAAAVVAGIATLVLAVRSDDGLVADDYYRQGLEINRRMDRERRARELGLVMDLELDATHLQLRVAQAAGQSYPLSLDVQLIHATRPGLDRSFRLDVADAGMHRIDMAPLAGGPWYVRVSGEDWRLQERHLVISP